MSCVCRAICLAAHHAAALHTGPTRMTMKRPTRPYGNAVPMSERTEGRKYKVENDTTLLEYLFSKCKGESRTTVKSYLSRGQILVNGRNVTAFDFGLHKGDSLVILDQATRFRKHSGEMDTRVRIVYEDEHLIVADKRHAVLTMSTGREGEVTAYSLLTGYVRRQAARAGRKTAPGEPRIFIVHRLDRDTSGLIIFAKDEQTQARLQDGWNENILERKYVAVVEGTPQEKSGTCTSWLNENPKSLKMTSSPVDNGGKKAVTHYNTISSAGGYSLVEFELETGRKNQIRIHALEMGCPVAGDKKYGARSNPLGRLALHAQSIAFRHPWTRKMMRFDTGIPRIFKSMFPE